MIIAVTTFFQSQTNYGQLLQGYALQQVLMQQGHYPYIVQYGFHEHKPSVLGIDYPSYSLNKLQSQVQITADSGTKSNRHFDDFRRQHLNLSANFYNSLLEIQENPPLADCYITGSDQVWAQLLSREDNRIFFLDFGSSHHLRIAYAPSFSLESYPEELVPLLGQHLHRFDALSVREKSGVGICRKAGYEALCVVDPTMLLDGEYYRQLAKESTTEMPTDYMLVYHVNIQRRDLPCWDSISQYNQRQGLRAVAVHANSEGRTDSEFLEDAEYLYPCIQDWIRLIDGSRYVLTSSFHGMIFSILLHKPFLVSLRPEFMFAGNDRIFTILQELGLEDRIATSEVDMDKLMSQPINWSMVDQRVEHLRQQSLDFLKESLQKAEGRSQQEHREIMLQDVIDKGEKISHRLHQLQTAFDDKEKQIEAESQQFGSLQEKHQELQSTLRDMQSTNQNLQLSLQHMNHKNEKHLKQVRLLGWVAGILTLLLVLALLF